MAAQKKSDENNASVTLASFKLKSNQARSFCAEAAFWPKDKPVTMQKLSDILYKDWKLPRPNLVVNLDAGTAHPGEFTTKLLRDLDQFQPFREYAKTQLDGRDKLEAVITDHQQQPEPDSRSGTKQAADASESPSGSKPAPAEDLTESIINRVVFDKIVTVFSALLDASEKTNNYIIVDRTNPSGSSSTAELLLELALQQTDAAPTILVIEKRSRLWSYHGREAERQLELINKIERSARIQGTDEKTQQVEFQSLYAAHEFGSKSFRGSEYCKLDLPREPDPTHIISNGVSVNVSRPRQQGEDQHDSHTVKINSKRLWSYHYTQYMFGSGTHYIFLEDDDQHINHDMLGTVGGVFAHGGSLAYNRIRLWLQRGKPTVMLFNTGGVTQAFASLHSSIVKKNTSDINDILKMVQVTSTENWAMEFGVSDVVLMQELVKRAPVVARKAIVSVDILKDSAEDVLHVVTGCFASALGHLPELGLRTAEAYVVLQAWNQHMILHKSAQGQRFYADALFSIQVALLFFTSLLAATRAEYQLQMAGDDQDQQDGLLQSETIPEVLRYAVVCIPIFSALVATVIQRKRALEKWGTLTACAARIVSEIYKFRARVLEYDACMLSAVEDQVDDETEAGLVSNEGQDRKMRMRFVKRVQAIFSEVLDGDLDSDALDIQKTSITSIEGHAPPVDEDALRTHVMTNLLKMPGDSHSYKEQQVAKGKMDTMDIFEGIEEDDLKSSISIETYIAKRTQPILAHFCAKAPKISRRYTRLEYLGMLINAAAVGLAIPGTFNNWVTMVISMRALVMNVLQYQAYHLRLAALNKGVRDMQNLMTWWHSLSVIDRRTRMAKTEAVIVTEQAMLNESLARTAEVASVFTNMEKDAGGAEEVEKAGAKGKAKNA